MSATRRTEKALDAAWDTIQKTFDEATKDAKDYRRIRDLATNMVPAEDGVDRSRFVVTNVERNENAYDAAQFEATHVTRFEPQFVQAVQIDRTHNVDLATLEDLATSATHACEDLHAWFVGAHRTEHLFIADIVRTATQTPHATLSGAFTVDMLRKCRDRLDDEDEVDLLVPQERVESIDGNDDLVRMLRGGHVVPTFRSPQPDVVLVLPHRPRDLAVYDFAPLTVECDVYGPGRVCLTTTQRIGVHAAVSIRNVRVQLTH
jgi:hypothetical protein